MWKSPAEQTAGRDPAGDLAKANSCVINIEENRVAGNCGKPLGSEIASRQQPIRWAFSYTPEGNEIPHNMNSLKSRFFSSLASREGNAQLRLTAAL